jgi:hypothetical protein
LLPKRNTQHNRSSRHAGSYPPPAASTAPAGVKTRVTIARKRSPARRAYDHPPAHTIADPAHALPHTDAPPLAQLPQPAAAPLSPGILADRWPTLARALGRYEHATADRFSTEAYLAVTAGIIRLDDRRRLAKLADTLAIRPFDAQLLIACAVRRWALDHHYDPTPTRHAPALSFEYKAYARTWLRLGIVAATAAILDGMIIWKWFS